MLERWRELLTSWRSQGSPQRPSQLRALVVGGGREGPRGVPESVRGQVWPLLARAIPASALLTDALGASQRRLSGSPLTSSPAREPRPELSTCTSGAPSAASPDARPVSGASSYQELSARDCSGEVDLQKDLARTFPQHEFFRQPEAAGQAALHRLCRVRASICVYGDEYEYLLLEYYSNNRHRMTFLKYRLMQMPTQTSDMLKAFRSWLPRFSYTYDLFSL